jgi:hypothetical protein
MERTGEFTCLATSKVVEIHLVNGAELHLNLTLNTVCGTVRTLPITYEAFPQTNKAF